MPILSGWIGVGIVGVRGRVDEWVSLRQVAESREELCEELVVAGLKLGQDVVGHGQVSGGILGCEERRWKARWVD